MSDLTASREWKEYKVFFSVNESQSRSTRHDMRFKVAGIVGEQIHPQLQSITFRAWPNSWVEHFNYAIIGPLKTLGTSLVIDSERTEQPSTHSAA